MTTITKTKMIRHGSAKSAARVAVATFLVFGALAISASAEERHDDAHHGDYRGHDRDQHDVYRGPAPYYAPPVVYGAPAYYPPPVVYGPGIGISIGID